MKKRKGQTLVEIMVATVVAATAATATFSVVLSAQVSGLKSDKREAAAMVVKAAQEQLKMYVSAVPGEEAFSPNLPGAGGVGRWSLDTSGVWALHGIASSPGFTHNIDGLVTSISQLKGTTSALNPTLSYNVENQDCGFGTGDALACKLVTFNLTYEN